MKVELAFSFLVAESILHDRVIRKVAELRQVIPNSKAAYRSSRCGSEDEEPNTVSARTQVFHPQPCSIG